MSRAYMVGHIDREEMKQKTECLRGRRDLFEGILSGEIKLGEGLIRGSLCNKHWTPKRLGIFLDRAESCGNCPLRWVGKGCKDSSSKYGEFEEMVNSRRKYRLAPLSNYTINEVGGRQYNTLIGCIRSIINDVDAAMAYVNSMYDSYKAYENEILIGRIRNIASNANIEDKSAMILEAIEETNKL